MQNQAYLYRGPNHVAINNMRLQDKDFDVTIKVDGTEIRAHKVILAANLKYFEMMLSTDSFQESRSGVITMESVEKADLELFVSYAYTGEILLTDSNALNLLELASYLSEDGITEACIGFLDKHLKSEEACRAYKFADTIGCLSLKNTAKAKIIANFGDYSESAEYLDFDSESLIDILSYGKAQSTQMQKILLERVIKWICHDAGNRKDCLKDLLESIYVTKLTTDVITSCINKYTVHCNDEYGIRQDVINYYEARKVARKEDEEVLVVLSQLGYFQFYNFTEKKWSSEQQIANAAFNHFENSSSAVLNDELYYIIEDSGNNYLQVFNPSSKQVTRLHSSSSILNYACLCACSRFVYICGGRKSGRLISDQLLRYDPQTNALETLAPMRHPRLNAAVTFHQDCLYVVGGHNGSSHLQSAEKFDPVGNEWTALAPMSKKRYKLAVAILDGKLYACGGCSHTGVESSVEVYDPIANSWHLAADINAKGVPYFVCAHKGKLLSVAGFGENTVEVYDPSRDQWQVDDEMSSGLQASFCIGGLFPSNCLTIT